MVGPRWLDPDGWIGLIANNPLVSVQIVIVDVPLIDGVPYGAAKCRHNDLDGSQVTKGVVIGAQTEDVFKHVGSVVR